MFQINKKYIPIVISGAIILFVFVYFYFFVFDLKNELKVLKLEMNLNKLSLIETRDSLGMEISDLDKKTLDLAGTLSENIDNTQANLNKAVSKIGGVEKTVEVLEKLSKTDPEILQKYSQVFFLNEHYAPARLSLISKENLYIESKPEFVSDQIMPYLQNLLSKAKEDNVEIYVKSGYRSFEEQKSIKSSYSIIYGQGTASQFSADQGYSEHQLGTTVDFITVGLGGRLDGFENTEAYQWLLKNAYQYGFVLSYPENNKYYIFEPWHWRYVGVKLATRLFEEKEYFYDLDQREIDEYLVDLF